MKASESQYDTLAKYSMRPNETKWMFLSHYAEAITLLKRQTVPSKNMALAMKKMRPVQNHRVNKTRWCVLRWPNPAMAQQAGMSTEAFEDFSLDVCLLNYKKLLPDNEASGIAHE